MGLTVIDQSEPLVVRMVSREDAGAVAELSGQLGYETSAEAMAERIGIVAGHPESQIVFVACLRGELVGWIEASISHHLQSPAYSLISGLVVRDGVRSLGTGRRLCAEVERWSREKGVMVVRVTSRASRGDAHRFYLREGFEQIKTSAVFEKVLS
jgi:GNAT superfamily N-acetyltransferase